MKGIVFTEFAELVEGTFGEDMMDTLIENTNPPSEGAYTAVGSYDFEELAAMVTELSRLTNIEASKLLYVFGEHLAKTFTSKFAQFFVEAGSATKFLKHVDDHVHVEVKKLYPDAETPAFDFREDPQTGIVTMVYESRRPLADVAHGLIVGVCSYYDEQFNISREDWYVEDVYCCRFTLEAA
ncbi:heme NO-binding domain-containing protein [Glaciecola sp. 1036]|uniref:heme NO-binding domain-containing protein n=1 Tax=Alteromonadaceae TaxID=72275 RepID=UPI003D01BA0D